MGLCPPLPRVGKQMQWTVVSTYSLETKLLAKLLPQSEVEANGVVETKGLHLGAGQSNCTGGAGQSLGAQCHKQWKEQR